MGSTIKTKVNEESVEDFINRIPDTTKRQDSFTILEIYKRVTNEPSKMWGNAIIGFGKYRYKSERSNQEGDWPLAGFSPRKQNLTLYVMPYYSSLDLDGLLARLGKHKTSKACLYINKLTDVDMSVLENIIRKSYLDAKKHLLN